MKKIALSLLAAFSINAYAFDEFDYEATYASVEVRQLAQKSYPVNSSFIDLPRAEINQVIQFKGGDYEVDVRLDDMIIEAESDITHNDYLAAVFGGHMPSMGYVVSRDLMNRARMIMSGDLLALNGVGGHDYNAIVIGDVLYTHDGAFQLMNGKIMFRGDVDHLRVVPVQKTGYFVVDALDFPMVKR